MWEFPGNYDITFYLFWHFPFTYTLHDCSMTFIWQLICNCEKTKVNLWTFECKWGVLNLYSCRHHNLPPLSVETNTVLLFSNKLGSAFCSKYQKMSQSWKVKECKCKIVIIKMFVIQGSKILYIVVHLLFMCTIEKKRARNLENA